jgi:hypothetical protein
MGHLVDDQLGGAFTSAAGDLIELQAGLSIGVAIAIDFGSGGDHR